MRRHQLKMIWFRNRLNKWIIYRSNRCVFRHHSLSYLANSRDSFVWRCYVGTIVNQNLSHLVWQSEIGFYFCFRDRRPRFCLIHKLACSAHITFPSSSFQLSMYAFCVCVCLWRYCMIASTCFNTILARHSCRKFAYISHVLHLILRSWGHYCQFYSSAHYRESSVPTYMDSAVYNLDERMKSVIELHFSHVDSSQLVHQMFNAFLLCLPMNMAKEP